MPKKDETKEEALTAVEVAAVAEAEAKAAAARLEAAKSKLDAEAKAEYDAAASEVVASTVGDSFTNKYTQERIFRRELEEPEFWLAKHQQIPPRPVLSRDEELEISRKAQIPIDQTPEYQPTHILSPEFGGISNYESGMNDLLDETKQKLDRLLSDPNSSTQEIKQVELDLKKLDNLHENFNLGMNVFRTAKGGRSKLRE